MPRRANHNLPAVQAKRAQVVELRARGLTWDQIAARVGYSNGSAASKAWKAAIQQRPDLTVDEVRAQEKTRLEQMDSVLAEVIAHVPIKSTAIGRVMWDPRSCTCGVRGDTKREHAEDCQVVPVLDTGQVTAAVRARLAVGESYRKLVGADQATPPAIDAEHLRIVTEIEAEIARRRAAGLELPPMPTWRAEQIGDEWVIVDEPKAIT